MIRARKQREMRKIDKRREQRGNEMKRKRKGGGRLQITESGKKGGWERKGEDTMKIRKIYMRRGR